MTDSTPKSPFKHEAKLIKSISCSYVTELYKRKCGADISEHFANTTHIDKYECSLTGYQFWRPKHIAGNETFYQQLESAWENYYRSSRWEYQLARKHITSSMRVLEVGCGKGYFLKSIEHINANNLGLELNQDAINHKVTKSKIANMQLENLSIEDENFDVVCTFQVLEHLSDPAYFIECALRLLPTNGLLIISTPNRDFVPFQLESDAFDLPPHHMGSFNERSFIKIAELYNLQVIATHKESRKFSLETTTPSTHKSTIYKATKYLINTLMNFAYKITKEPGPTILVVFKKI